MSEEEGMFVAKELLGFSEDVYLSYNRLLNYKFVGDNKSYDKELSNLSNLIKKESVYYKNIDDRKVLYLLNEMDTSEMLSSIENIFDKYLNIVNLGFSFNEVSYYRILNLLRDNYILNSRLSRFDDNDLFEDDIDLYNDKMLNNLIIENQLFNDFVSLYVANLNEYIEKEKDYKIKKDLITYKYVVSYVYGKNNFELLEDRNFDNTYVYSRYLYDILINADKEVSYSYDIMKFEYLDRVLYNFLKDYREYDGVNNIINLCFMKSIIMLYQDDYKRVNKIYDDLIYVGDKKMDNIVDNSYSYASKVKVLTLNK